MWIYLDLLSILLVTGKNYFVTGRNEVVAKVIFLHLFVILFTGGRGFCLNACWDINPPGSRLQPPSPPPDQAPPPGSRLPARKQIHPPPPGPGTPQSRDPPWTRHPYPPLGSRLQHTVYKRPVSILLECILVDLDFFHMKQKNSTISI